MAAWLLVLLVIPAGLQLGVLVQQPRPDAGCFAAISTVDGGNKWFRELSGPGLTKILVSIHFCLSSQIMLKSLN